MRRESTTDVLMQELGQIREDDRSALVQISTIMGVALALIVVITELAIYFRHTLPWIVYLTVPVLPSVLVTYVLLLGTNASVRTYYARSLELQLIKRIEQDRTKDLAFPSWSHFESRLNGTNAIAPMAVNWLLVYFGCLFIVVGWMAFVIFTQFLGWHLKVVASIFDVCLLVPPMTLAALNTTRARSTWRALEKDVSSSRRETSSDFRPSARSTERTLSSFLLLPRYEDLAVKAWFIPFTFLVFGFIAHKPMFSSLVILPAVGVWLVFEVVIYQSRYLINDVRGRVEDNSPSTRKRRFPGSYVYCPTVAGSDIREAIAVHFSYLSFMFRLFIGSTLFFTFAPPRYFAWLVCMIFLLSFGLSTLVYEWIRRATDRLFNQILDVREEYSLATDSRLLAFDSFSVRQRRCRLRHSLSSGIVASGRLLLEGPIASCAFRLGIRVNVRLHDLDHRVDKILCPGVQI